jgi:hypothetical protein
MTIQGMDSESARLGSGRYKPKREFKLDAVHGDTA